MIRKITTNIFALVILLIIEFILAYVFISLAINTGNLIFYFLTILVFINFIENVVILIKRIIRKYDQGKSS